MFEKIFEQVKKANNIIIFPHVSMDGDSVGSAKALALAFSDLGKNVIILADEHVPSHVRFLDCDLFRLEADFVPDLAFAVDCSDVQRIENRLNVYKSAKCRVCIDHHPGKDDFADYIVRDTEAPAAALLVYDFLKESGISFNREIAEAVYTGILTDTGAFKYSNTDARTHRTVAELYDYGIDHAAICVQVYDNKPLVQLKLESKSLEIAEIICDGKAVISHLDYDYWKGIDADYSYTESAIDEIRKIEGVEIAAILKEKEPGVFKLSMRAKSYADVSAIAYKLGGGGHKKAAACTLDMPLEDALKLVKEEVCKAL